MVHSVSSISSFVGIFTCSQAKWTRSRDVPASLESLLPSSHLAKPSRIFHAQTVALSHKNNKRSTSPPQMTPSPITHPPSPHHIPHSLHHHLPFPRQQYHRNLTLIAGASTTARCRHAAQSGTTSTSLLLSLIGGTRKTQRLARQRAVGSMITNLLLQTTRVVRSASLCELLNATSTQASKILIIMLLQPE
jgi:hypothetical protein